MLRKYVVHHFIFHQSMIQLSHSTVYLSAINDSAISSIIFSSSYQWFRFLIYLLIFQLSMTAIMERRRNVVSWGKDGSDVGQQRYLGKFNDVSGEANNWASQFIYFFLWEYNLISELSLQFCSEICKLVSSVLLLYCRWERIGADGKLLVLGY